MHGSSGKFFIFTLLVGVFSSCGSFAYTEDELNVFLKRFREDPRAVMNKLPQRIDPSTKQPTSDKSVFPDKLVRSGEFLDVKNRGRREIIINSTYYNEQIEALRKLHPGSKDAPIKANDDPQDLIDDPTAIMNLNDMEANGLMAAVLETSPWSDDYWAIYKGILGARYADRSFPASPDWSENFKYISQRPAADVIAGGDKKEIDNLSPSEKYELVLGDNQANLTKRMWEEGRVYYERFGEVEAWFGICHGWAPASFMLQRPSKSVIVPSASGSFDVTFYPSDIKALATLLWANAKSSTKFLGGRCNDKKPKTDGNGRVISEDCFDNNPGSWHMAVVGQLGVAKRSMVMDASFDYTVWNQPLHSYKYTYFNPQTLRAARSLSGATVQVSQFSSDKFKKYRSENTKYVVGINFEVTYIVETMPSHNKVDKPENDGMRSVTYIYDLELDENKNIIGGEWYSNFHPDFLWTPVKGTRASTAFESFAREPWVHGSGVPASWLEGATQASKSGKPLAAFVEHLIKEAQ